ncbi:MAG: GntR family transcriptional regulator [Gammaproteobacteria bacterium]|nr:GntR family transcriptional regulator [Gammaproteobacteria bacterium]NIR83332.1 GntR family transcriptional regulator [Gammaproteobacteria bacterium]NIR91132.1 GntR family transcriptional regulator [Gammaproteobacteria bacterium]NIU04499.1 GntR family transcriptional regulator [Gammaproteobacteria bacterium]NIW87135.1 FCD domain-containing protein [Gammaproteobacteria bacterium]
MGAEKLEVERLPGNFVLKDRIYEALKRAIMSMDVYATAEEQRLDERQLSEDLGVSRTPIREALCRLEQEGFVRTVPRKGAYVARKSKREIMEIITVWAALESMAARLVTLNASDEEIRSLRRMFATFKRSQVEAKIDEYSETNISFHQAIVNLCGCEQLKQMAENLFIHMRWIRMRTIGEDDRARRSIIDHMNIIEALEARDTELAERLVREHALNLAGHVEKNVDYLD